MGIFFLLRNFQMFLHCVIFISFLTVSLVGSADIIEKPGNTSKEQLKLDMEYFEVYLPSSIYVESAQDNLYLEKYGETIDEISRKCPKSSFFASYNPVHQAAVVDATKICTTGKDEKDLVKIAKFLKSRSDIHPRVWLAGFVKAQEALNTQTWSKPHASLIDLFPTNFFPNNVYSKNTADKTHKYKPPSNTSLPLIEASSNYGFDILEAPASNCGNTDPILLDERFGQDNGIENLLWYFREDVQMNAFHWNWHLVYPIKTEEQIQRRGELFYFVHHELLARYTTERISNGLLPPIPLDMPYNTMIKEGYNAHLRDGISSSNWVPRPPNSHLSSLNEEIFENLVNLTVNKDRFLKSLSEGAIFRNYVRTPFNNEDNINILGEAAEASNHSINQEYYGMEGYHNDGHWVIANLGNVTKDEFGPMGDVATAMRDPVFYRWHTRVDNLFMFYKAKHLPPYSLQGGEHPLVVSELSVADVKVVSNQNVGATNFLHTFWNVRRFKLRAGLDFNAQNGSNYVNQIVLAKHLDHEEFIYQIIIDNARSDLTIASVRIFMAPRYKSIHQNVRYTIDEQRNLFFSMDSFAAELQPGRNFIQRKSEESTVTAHWTKSIEEMKETIKNVTFSRSDCECGYPHHLLLPRGTETGMTFDLFVMVTDGFADEVNETQPTSDNYHCQPNHVYCGGLGKYYPDAKPMGYPFDRRPYIMPTEIQQPWGERKLKNIEVPTLEEYVRHIPNAATTQVVIRHVNKQVWSRKQ